MQFLEVLCVGVFVCGEMVRGKEKQQASTRNHEHESIHPQVSTF